MIFQQRPWLPWGFLAVAALGLLYFSWRAGQNAEIVVEWSTASELDTAGFNLYRSDKQGGPFLQINEALIPGAADQLTGGDYAFTDSGVTPGVTYYYQLEEVEITGVTNRTEPIQVLAEAEGKTVLVIAVVLFLGASAGLVAQFVPWGKQA